MFFVVLAKLKKFSPAFMEATEKALKSPPPGLKIHNVFLAALTARWIVWILDVSETLIWVIGIVAFVIIFVIDLFISDP